MDDLTRIYAFFAAIGAALLAVMGAWLSGKRDGKADEKAKEQKRNDEAHDRINKAPTGADLSDDERVQRLKRLGREWDGH